MLKRLLMILLLVVFLPMLIVGCGGQTEPAVDLPEEPEAATAPDPVLGVIVGYSEAGSDYLITMLIDGNEEELPISEDLYANVVEEWEHYSHWGLYQATFDAEGVVTGLEYGMGVADIIGIFSDYYSDKELSDVIEVEANTVTIISTDYLLDSDDPDDLPGFSTEVNDSLTPAVGESFELSDYVIVYVEGSDGLFFTGDTSYIDSPGYDYVEFYDVDGNFLYDIVVVWLV